MDLRLLGYVCNLCSIQFRISIDSFLRLQLSRASVCGFSFYSAYRKPSDHGLAMDLSTPDNTGYLRRYSEVELSMIRAPKALVPVYNYSGDYSAIHQLVWSASIPQRCTHRSSALLSHSRGFSRINMDGRQLMLVWVISPRVR